MSISKMDWSGRNSNGALAHPNSQQYLPVSTSSTVQPSHTVYVPQNSYSLAQTLVASNRNPILIGLLGADSSEQLLKIERSALSKTPAQQTTQVSPGQYNSSYNLLHKKSTAENHYNGSNIQTVVVSNYQTQVYPNSVLHTLQQGQQLPVVQQQAQQLPVVQQQAQAVQCYGANGYNTGQVQQSLQIPQSDGYTQRKTHQRMLKTYVAKRPNQKVQGSYWTILPQPNSVNINSAQNGSTAPNVSSYKSLNNNIVPVSTANYQNGQNIHNQMGSNYQAISHASTLQPQQGMNDYVQSPQRQTQNLHSGFANNSNALPSATVGQTPLLYTQSNANVYNVSVNHNLSNPSQSFVTQNVQQPMQSYTLPQDQLSVAVPPPAYSENVQQGRRRHLQEILVLLKEYRDVKLKYLLLNRENNHLRQKMQSTSQDIPGSCPVRPPLISSILNTTVPANDSMGGQKVSQNSSMQSQPPSNTTHVQTPALYDSLNVPIQNVAQPSNSLSSHVYPTSNSNVLNQTNYAGFESDQMNLGSRASSTGQVVNSDTLRVQDPRANFMQINNKYHSSNSTNGSLSQDELHITSVQTNTVASESCNPVHTTNTGNFYANTPLSSSSREAINATLPLWKSVPQSSAQNKRGFSEPKHMVDHVLDTPPVLSEIASHSIYEPTAVTRTQKSEHSGPIVAVVSPLVKIKEFVEINQHPKVPQGKDFAIGVKENYCIKKLLLPLESVDAAMKNLDTIPPISNMVSSKSNIDQKSTENVETVDENLQISGICTLVEGNSFYDSSVAMMFEGSSQTQIVSPLAKRDPEDRPILQGSQDDTDTWGAFQATSSVPPTTEMVAVESESQGDSEPSAKIQDNRQGADVCHEIQSEQNLSASDAFNLSSNAASDQLSDLLTEFPFGIKNYMSEKDLKSTGEFLEKKSKKTEIPKTFVTFSYDNVSDDGSIEDTQRVDAMDTSTKETESLRTEITYQQSTLEQPRDEAISVQFDEDGFEISDSPDGDIQITLLNQDEITKIFPEDSAKPIVDSKESVVESLAKEPTTPVADVSVNSIKENSNDETASTSENVLFCCLFSWLTHTNGNAPKCNCKLTELCDTEYLTSNISQPTAVSKTEPLTAFLEPSTGDHDSTTDLQPSPHPCNTELDEILPPAIKRPKCKPTDISSESKPGPRIVNCSPQEMNPKPNLSFKYFKDKLQKELRKNETLVNEKILQSKSHLEDPNSKKTKEPFSGYKSNVDSSRKLEKLIIKTDFLKNKHFLKMKKKYKERKTSRFEEGAARSVKKSNKNAEVGESVKILNTDRVIGSKANNEKCKELAATVKQFERTMNKLKSSSSSDKAHSHTKDRSPGKRRGRVKSQPASHFEKVKKVPTVQEYLERKRELCNQRSVPTVDQRDDATEVRHRVVEKHSMERSGNSVAKLLRPLSPAKMNVKTKNIESDATNHTRKGRPRVGGEYESLDKKHRGSTSGHGKRSLVSKVLDQKSTFQKEKIYLTPCDSSRRASCDGISLTKLQIRCSPEKPVYSERRKSLDSSVHSKLSKSETKNGEAPKMLEFKLCPEFVHRSPSTPAKKEPKAAKEKSVIEGIKSKKEAWCSGGPVKKSRMGSISEDQGCSSPALSTSSFKSAEKNSPRPLQDSQTTFNVFKQMYHEQRSKSLDASL